MDRPAEIAAATASRDGLRSESALACAYRAHGAEIYRYAWRALRDEGVAQDVVQEVFLRAWRAGDRYRAQRASLRVWLFAITRNAVVDEVRRRAARPSLVVPLDPDAPGPGDFVEVEMTRWLVDEAIQRLSVDHRSAIVETYLRGRPYAEVADEQGVPVGTLRSRVFYGLKELRLIMDEMGAEL